MNAEVLEDSWQRFSPIPGCPGFFISLVEPQRLGEQLQRWILRSVSTAIEMPEAPAGLHLRPEGSTSESKDDLLAIEEDARSLLECSAPEDLEDGMDTPLIPGLFRLIRSHGAGAVLELAGLIESGSVDPHIASWMLRWLGRIPHHSTHQVRRWLLERGLRSPVAMIRDGAALGLAALRDPRAAPALRAAVEREPYKRLRRNIERALLRVERSA